MFAVPAEPSQRHTNLEVVKVHFCSGGSENIAIVSEEIQLGKVGTTRSK